MDTRLEAKAKDIKKNLRPMQRTDFPGTDPLEAKDKNAKGQRPRTQHASILHKKKVLCAKKSQIFCKISGVFQKQKKSKKKKRPSRRKLQIFREISDKEKKWC